LDVRRARRTIWTIRLIFYPAAVIGAVLLLAGRGHAESSKWLTGTTSQGTEFALRLDDGKPGRLTMAFKTHCPGGEWTMKWWPYGPFHLEDNRLRIRETTTHRYTYHDQTSRRVVTFDARVRDCEVLCARTALALSA
jgi:hypothetical protein